MTGRIAAVLTATFLALAAGGANAEGAQPQVRVATGTLAGVRADGVESFKNIPYAAPPVGPLRWRPPQPAKPWAGVRPADKMGALCEQAYNPKDNGVGPLPASEDCLTVNVFAPAKTMRGAKALPVMVWIHGGGFVNGSGTAALYDGTGLAKQGVVVVTLNYRLSRFGFFAHPALTAEAKGQPVGNYGLMDMIAALKWVRANIGRFGGDPSRVTIFGESAGGIAVNDLMVSPAARGLFIRAIVESGAGREPAPPLKTAEAQGVAFAAKVGLANASAADLRKLSAEQILKAGDPDIRLGGGTMADGKILTLGPAEGFAKGLEAKVPYIVGTNALEFPIPEAQRQGALDGLIPRARQAPIAAAYADPATFGANVVSDVFFTEPGRELARRHAANGQPTWLYRFSVLSPSMKGRLQGAPHASERQYVFETLATSPWPTDANDAAQARTMSAYWAAFGRTGDPNGGGRVRWPKYDRARDELLDFTNDGPVLGHPAREKALDAIAASYR